MLLYINLISIFCWFDHFQYICRTGLAHLFPSWEINGKMGIRIRDWEHPSPGQHPEPVAEVTHSETRKGGRKGKKKQMPYLLSKAFKMLGQLTREVGVFKSMLEACFNVMCSHSAGKFCSIAS